MARWEYVTIQVERAQCERGLGQWDEKKLDLYGRDGWEAVGMKIVGLTMTVLMKREVVDTPQRAR